MVKFKECEYNGENILTQFGMNFIEWNFHIEMFLSCHNLMGILLWYTNVGFRFTRLNKWNGARTESKEKRLTEIVAKYLSVNEMNFANISNCRSNLGLNEETNVRESLKTFSVN